jgi:hypothetical protein
MEGFGGDMMAYPQSIAKMFSEFSHASPGMGRERKERRQGGGREGGATGGGGGEGNMEKGGKRRTEG